MAVERSYPPVGTGGNSVVQELREMGPRTSDELPRKVSATDRRYVGGFDASRSSTGGRKSRGRTVGVYYLYGDERRAVRKYIEENREFVESCIQDRVNPISIKQEEYWWGMFKEEWSWSGYGREAEL